MVRDTGFLCDNDRAPAIAFGWFEVGALALGVVDQEKTGVPGCGSRCDVIPRAGGLLLEDAFHPPSSMSSERGPAAFFPRTRRSKSPTSPLLALSVPFEKLSAPNDMMSLLRVFVAVVAEFDDSSSSFFICSSSTFDEIDLMRLMYSRNCCRLSNGPKLKLHNTGRTSMARKSESAILPTCLNTLKAAI